MSLKSIHIVIVLLVCFNLELKGQETYNMRPYDKKVEIDLLSSYYEQDGNNSPVTGGIGTEALTDVANMIIVNMPLDSSKSISIMAGADNYTSASTDNIDNNVSSESIQDTRIYGNLGFSLKNLNRGESYKISIGSSVEYDYFSLNGALSYSVESRDGNREFNVTAKVFIDQWSLYFPRELKGEVTVPTKNRRSYSLALNYSQVINKRLQFSISGEGIFMNGLLSTPFHRVYFENGNHDIERLPGSRLKIPLGIRINYFPVDALVLRTYYRYYWDDFGIKAHTASIEIPVKVSPALTVAPFYRYHRQTASNYFAPINTHQFGQEFYSSDFDLSHLTSFKAGVDISISPVFGMGGFKMWNGKALGFKSINIRPAYYKRSNGLSAFSISLGLSFAIE